MIATRRLWRRLRSSADWPEHGRTFTGGNYARFKNPQTNRTFSEQVDKITGKKNTMDIFEQVAEMRHEEGLHEGLKKGLRKGAQQTKRRVVEKLIKNSKLSLNEIASVADVSLIFVKKVKKELDNK
jgi:flagellar biosynthesis/type III secretory pathway protein FliH